MGRKLTVTMVIEFFVFSALLFGGAGTLDWPAAWAFIGLFFVCSILLVLALARNDPRLLDERMKPMWQAGQPLWDKIFLSLVAVVWCAWLVLMGMDAVRYGWAPLPAFLQWLGAGGLILGNWIVHLTFRENTFAAPVIKIQTGHKVISTGPYATVRHPMYAGAGLYFPAIPLMLGSGWGLVVGVLFVVALTFRIYGEERELEMHLEGYSDYKQHVRYRLIPGVW